MNLSGSELNQVTGFVITTLSFQVLTPEIRMYRFCPNMKEHQIGLAEEGHKYRSRNWVRKVTQVEADNGVSG
jgi:hypothetical protein